jgi:hypothetical protein
MASDRWESFGSWSRKAERLGLAKAAVAVDNVAKRGLPV